MLQSAGSPLDYLALGFLLVSWISYTLYASYKANSTVCLSSALGRCHSIWMMRILERENRVADASLLSNLRASVSFFASTSIFVMAGLIAAIAASEQAIDVLATIPFVNHNTRELCELKMLVMVVIFIYSFFEFTWSLRLYNSACVVMGSAPLAGQVKDDRVKQQRYAQACGFIMTLAATHFNYGLRGYYFAVATLSWFIGPKIMMLVAMLVVVILYSREFHSRVLEVLCEYNLPNS